MLASRIFVSLSAVLTLSTALVLTGCGEKPQQQQGPVEVGVYTVVARPIAMTATLPGRLAAYAVAEVRPQVSGIVLKRSFQEGAYVKTGQQLYQIDPATYKAQYESAKGALAKAEANATTQRLKAERYRELVKNEAVSKQEYDDAVAAMKQAAADVQSNRAAVETARINLVYTQVNAPISGRIGRSSVTQGALVTANQANALATVQQLDPIYVDVNQSSAEYLRLRQDFDSGRLQKSETGGAKVKLIMEDGTEYPLAGTLQLSDINVDPTTSAVTIRAIVPNPDGLLLPGVFVRAKLEEGVNERGILVPQPGVMRDQKGEPYVFVVDKDNKVQIRPIKTGQAVGNQWIVLSGISAGEKIIVTGLQRVKAGVAVKTVPAKVDDTSGLVVASEAAGQNQNTPPMVAASEVKAVTPAQQASQIAVKPQASTASQAQSKK